MLSLLEEILAADPDRREAERALASLAAAAAAAAAERAESARLAQALGEAQASLEKAQGEASLRVREEVRDHAPAGLVLAWRGGAR